MRVICFYLLWLISSNLHSAEDCDPTQLEPSETTVMIESLTNICEALYVNVMDLKVSMDGDGQLDVYFEDGEPKILKLTYKNDKGTVTRQMTFEELAAGKALEYENTAVPGNAIIVNKGPLFDKESGYQFKISIRTSVNPDEYKSYDIDFNSDAQNPTVLFDDKKFKQLTLSPGVSFFSWNGTFKKVEFIQ